MTRVITAATLLSSVLFATTAYAQTGREEGTKDQPRVIRSGTLIDLAGEADTAAAEVSPQQQEEPLEAPAEVQSSTDVPTLRLDISRCRQCRWTLERLVDHEIATPDPTRLRIEITRRRSDRQTGAVLAELIAPNGTVLFSEWIDPIIVQPNIRLNTGRVLNMIAQATAAAPAAAAWAEADTSDGSSAVALLHRGNVQLLMGRAHIAKRDFRSALQRARAAGSVINAEAARLQLELVRHAEGDSDGALRELNELARSMEFPQSRAHAYRLIGSIHESRAQVAEAAAAYLNGANASPDAALASELTARANMLRGTLTDLGTSTGVPGLRLVPPRRRVLAGATTIRAIPGRPDVASVEFLLDGETRRTDSAPPFAATFDITPGGADTVSAIGRDARGAEVARDRLEINQLWQGLEASISGIDRAAGNARVTVQASSDISDPVSSVEFFWNGRFVARDEQPPWEATLPIADDSSGYVSVVAETVSGLNTEDARTIDLGDASEYIDVELYEIAARITNRRGEPVPDLQRDEVNLYSGDDEVELVNLEFAPAHGSMTFGLVIDTSTSMSPKILAVYDAARRFVDGATEAGARVFLMSFAISAEMLHWPTSDREALRQALPSTTAGGYTALWDAVSLAALQFDSRDGRRGLVVVTDGEDTASKQTLNDTTELAQRLGVPVFIIGIQDEDVVPTYESVLESGFSEARSLTAGTGGETYVLKGAAQLDEPLAEIFETIRDQYVLTFRPQPHHTGWRRIRIELSRPGLRVRTVNGILRAKDE